MYTNRHFFLRLGSESQHGERGHLGAVLESQALNQGIHFTASQVEDLVAALQKVRPGGGTDRRPARFARKGRLKGSENESGERKLPRGLETPIEKCDRKETF